MKSISLTLVTGETVTGTPNYVDEQVAELRLPNGHFRMIKRDQIVSAPSIAKVTTGLGA